MTKFKQNYCHQKEFKEARIDIRATPTEKAQLQLQARASGMSLGKYLIAAGLNKRPTKVAKAIDKSLYLELCRQGNNLARLARLHDNRAASGNYCKLDPEDRAMLEKIYALLRQTLDRLQGRKAD